MLNWIGIETTAEIRFPPEAVESGTYEGWRAAIDAAVAVADCPHWRLGAAAGFAGPILARCDFDTCGLNFSGATSRGKTTAEALAVSTWTSPGLTSGGLLRSMRATENSVELSARQANNMILGFDELAHVDGKMIGRTIYFLSGGVSKARMSSQLTMREQYTWRTIVLLSSEQSLAQKVADDGGQWTGGMAVRFVDVDCSDVDSNVPKKTLETIAGIYRNFGHGWHRFIAALMKAGLNKDPKRGDLRATILDLAARIAGENADGARRRAALPFALLATGGRLAQQFGVLPETADIAGAVTWGWERFIRAPGALALSPEVRALSNLRRWIAEHWDAALKLIDSPYHNARDALGWYDADAIYIPTDRILEAIGGVMSVRPFVSRVLEKQDLLQRRRDEHRAAIRSVPKIGKVDVYCLKLKAFRDE